MANFDFLLKIDIFRKSLTEQQAVLQDFWKKGELILSDSGISLQPVPEKWTTLRHNYFSVLFITIFHILKIPLPRLKLYARLNHCLRSWVTACDNLLDDELKEMLLTSLPENSRIFKSVHTLLVVDRIFFSFLIDSVRDGTISQHEMEQLLSISLTSLSESGIEEAGEEGGVDFFLPPEDVLQKIHLAKTGQLFTSPLAAPMALNDISDIKKGYKIRDGLSHLGLACQILDDLSDLGMDLTNRKHNYLASLIMHGEDTYEKHLLTETINSPETETKESMYLYKRFSRSAALAQKESLSHFRIALEYMCEGGLPFNKPVQKIFIETLMVIFGYPDLLVNLRDR